MRITWCVVWAAVACSGGEAPPAEPVAPEPVAPAAPVRPAAVSEAREAAYRALAPDGLWVQCPLGDLKVPVDGPLSATLSEDQVVEAEDGTRTVSLVREALTLMSVEGGLFTAVVPRATAGATLVRGNTPFALVSWRSAAPGQWVTCSPHEPYPFSVNGMVMDATGAPVEGASVIGCAAEAPVVTDARGRFDLPGVFGRSCVVVALQRGPKGLRISKPVDVDAGGADLLLDVTLPDAWVSAEDEATMLAQKLTIAEARVGSGIGQDASRLASAVGAAGLSGESLALADAWVADLKARESAERARLEKAKSAGADGLLWVPTEAY